MESDRFVVWPSVGALVPGWLLIVPKQHELNLAGLPPEAMAELAGLRDRAVRYLRQRVGPVVQFEHGPARIGLSAGCGVDHAHLHVVPTDVDLLTGAMAFRPDLRWDAVPSLAAARPAVMGGLSYLFLRDQADRGWLTCGPDLPSQFFRRLIAHAVGKPEQHDWKSFPCPGNIEETVGLFEDDSA